MFFSKDPAAMSICDRTEAALECLVLNSIEQQNIAKTVGHKERSSTQQWLQEWCQIIVGSPRRIGLTTSMIKIANSYFDHPVFILPNDSRVKTLRKMVKEEGFITSINLLRKLSRGRDFDAIFCEYITNKELPWVYEVAEIMLDKKQDKPFVLAILQPV